MLNLEVKSLQFLRDRCRRREFFLQDMRRRHGFAGMKPIPKRVSEIDVEDGDVLDRQDLPLEEISAINLVCWNCQKKGHRYQDCLSDRTIFCYGCGAPDTYKPNCLNCKSKNLKVIAPKSAANPPRSPNLE